MNRPAAPLPYVSDNPLTILSNVARGRKITAKQREILNGHRFTDSEIKNIAYADRLDPAAVRARAPFTAN